MKTVTRLFAVLLFSIVAHGQQMANVEQGLKPFGTYHGGDIDSVSMTNGNLTLHIPLTSYAQRGVRISTDEYLIYNGKNYAAAVTCTANYEPVDDPPSPTRPPGGQDCVTQVTFNGAGPGVHLLTPDAVAMTATYPVVGYTGDGSSTVYEKLLTVYSEDGSAHQLGYLGSAQQLGYGSAGSIYRAIDGTNWTFWDADVHEAIQNMPGSGTLWFPNGNSTTVGYGWDEFGQGAVPGGEPVTDPDGNFTTSSLISQTDTLGRSISVSYDSPLSQKCPVIPEALYQPLDRSETRSYADGHLITLCYANVNIRTHFFDDGQGVKINKILVQGLLQSVVLTVTDQNGVSRDLVWSFIYDSYNPGETDSSQPDYYAYGELQKVIFPTGGSLSYTWGAGPDCGGDGGAGLGMPVINHSVLTRTLDAADGTGAKTWRYQWFAGGYVDEASGLVTENIVVDPYVSGDPDGVRNETVHWISGFGTCSLVETRTDWYHGSHSTGNLLKTVTKHYRADSNALDSSGGTVGTIYVDSEKTTLDGMVSATTATDYGWTFSYEQRNIVYQPGYTPAWTTSYGSGTSHVLQPSAVSVYDYDGSLLKRTEYTYKAQTDSRYWNANLIDTPTAVVVKNAAATRVAETDYEYDGVATQAGCANSNHTAIAGNVRGHVTAVTNWLGTGTSPVTHTTWYDTGVKHVFRDALEHSTTYNYCESGDVYGAWPTSIVNAKGQTTKFTYDWAKGTEASTTDPNNETTSFTWDTLHRLTSAIYPDGGNITFTYASPNQTIRTQLQSAGGGTPPITDTANFDGVGRPRQSIHADSQGDDYVETEYDEVGRVRSVTNPYRSGETVYYSQTHYDATDRVKQVTRQDGGTVTTDYTANCSTSTDEAGKALKGYTDALGRLKRVEEPGDQIVPGTPAVPATTASGSATVSGSPQSAPDPAVPLRAGTGSVAISGSERSTQVESQAAKGGAGSVSINGSEQSKQVQTQAAAPGSAWVDVSGTEQSTVTTPAKPGAGTVTISGGERSAQVVVGWELQCASPSPDDQCVLERVPIYDTVWDSGVVSITVGTTTKNASYGQASTSATLAAALANGFNGDPSAPVTASVSGTTVSFTSKTSGATTNYALSASTQTNDPTDFTYASFAAGRSGATLTGGADQVITYDAGTVSITVNGSSKSVSFSQGSSAGSLASALAAAISGDGSSPVTASVSGARVNLTSRQSGAGTNYPLYSSWTYDSAHFGSSSFTTARSGGTLAGGHDAVYTTVYDSGTVTITVNGYPKSTSYGQGTTAGSIATALASAFAGDGAAPVTASASGSVVYLTARSTGTATNYPLSAGATYNSGEFGSASFAAAPSGGWLTGGANAGYTTIYDVGTVTVTVNGVSKLANYGQSDTSSTVAQTLATAFNSDSSSPVNALASGGTLSLTSKQPGAASNYTLSTASATTDAAHFSGTSFPSSRSGATLTGGQNQGVIYDSGSVSLTVGTYRASVNYDQNSTAISVASALAGSLNAGGSPVTASLSGTTISLTSKSAGGAANYSLSASASTSRPATFSRASFAANPSGGGLTGGTDGTPALPPHGSGQFSLATPFVTLYTYDPLDNLTCVEQHGYEASGTGCSADPSNDANSPWRVRRFLYNSLSQLTWARNPESGEISYTYNADGVLTSKTDARGITINYNPSESPIDALHRVTKKTYSNGDASVSYFYDQSSYDGLTIANGVGRRTGMSDQAGASAWTYDSMGRVTTARRTTNSQTKDFGYSYNLAGAARTLTYPSGRVVTYTYGKAGWPLSVQDGNGASYAANATYAPFGGLTGATLGTAPITISSTYNARLQPHIMSAAAQGQPLLSRDYDFHLGAGDNGNVYGITDGIDALNRSGRPVGSQVFTYDGLNRLTSAQSTGTDCTALPGGTTKNYGNSYLVDAWGNLGQKLVTKCTAEWLSELIDPATNRFMPGNPSAGRYDAAGNMTQYGAYAYDAEERIKTATGSATTYWYDGDGNRVRKSGGSNILYWTGSGADALAESDASGNVSSEYVYFGGKRVARIDNPGASETVHYYVSDHLGSATVIVSASGGVERESMYFPYGGERWTTGTDPNHYKFTGKERDETGLDYFGARYYGSTMGRWMSPDWAEKPVTVPYADLADPQTLNLYGYVRNIPTGRVDLDGHGGFWDSLKEFFRALVQPFPTTLQSAQGGTPLNVPEQQAPAPAMIDGHAVASKYADAVANGVEAFSDIADVADVTGFGSAVKSAAQGDNARALTPALLMLASTGKGMAPLHHIATDKSIVSGITRQFENLFAKAGMKLNSQENLMRLLGHSGRHTTAYSMYVLRSLTAAVRGLKGEEYRKALVDGLAKLRTELQKNPNLVKMR